MKNFLSASVVVALMLPLLSSTAAPPPKPASISGSQVWTNANATLYPLSAANKIGLQDTNHTILTVVTLTGFADSQIGVGINALQSLPEDPSGAGNDNGNSAFGGAALSVLLSGTGDTGLGNSAGAALISGDRNTFGGSGAGNFDGSTNSDLTLYGFQSGYHLLDNANPNDAFGSFSLTHDSSGVANAAFGYGSGQTITVGSSNIFLGHLADASATVANAIVIAHSTTATANNQVKIGNAANDFNVGVALPGAVVGANYTITGTTNQLIFGATNAAPIYGIVPDAFVSVQVAGSTNVYRMALYDLAGTNVTEAIINNNLTIQTNLTVNQTITTKVVKGGTLIITNVSFYGSVTNHNVATNSVIIADASQIETNAVNAHGVFTNTASGPPSFGLLQNTEIEHSVIEATNEVTRQINSGTNIYVSLGTAISDLSLGTNLNYRYTTNNSGTTTLSWGHAYRTNLAANVTIALDSISSAAASPFYETIIYWCTNSSVTDRTVTSPSGCLGPVGSGTPSVLTATNHTITRFLYEHYGPSDVTVGKSDFGP